MSDTIGLWVGTAVCSRREGGAVIFMSVSAAVFGAVHDAEDAASGAILRACPTADGWRGHETGKSLRVDDDQIRRAYAALPKEEP